MLAWDGSYKVRSNLPLFGRASLVVARNIGSNVTLGSRGSRPLDYNFHPLLRQNYYLTRPSIFIARAAALWEDLRLSNGRLTIEPPYQTTDVVCESAMPLRSPAAVLILAFGAQDHLKAER
jgi:hypothetical protein